MDEKKFVRCEPHDELNCLDCKLSYVDDLFFETMCHLNRHITSDEGICKDFEPNK